MSRNNTMFYRVLQNFFCELKKGRKLPPVLITTIKYDRIKQKN